jgi:quinoprotein glucose dehydrogenase
VKKRTDRAAMSCARLASALPCLALAGCAPTLQKPTDEYHLTSRERELLPRYRIIPAARDAELTAATRVGPEAFRLWGRSNGDAGNSRYSALDQINRDNVTALAPAWTYRSGATQNNNIQTNPVIVDGTLYAPATGKFLVALNAATGRERWRFHPPAVRVGEDYGPAHRGLTYWAGNAALAPRLFFTASGSLHALDPRTGEPVIAFGANGTVPARGAAAPVVFGDIVIVSDVRSIVAYRLRDGKPLWRQWALKRDRQWTLNPERGGLNDTGGNLWSGLALDEVRGLLFVASGDPHPNYWGTDRPGSNPHSNRLFAIDARDGHIIWSFQEVAHDLWDLDIPAPPNLVSLVRNGKRVDAVAQVTKLGNTLLLDRRSGKPIFPYRLRRAPASSIAGEFTAPYQPYLELPEPFTRQILAEDQLTRRSPDVKRLAQATFATANHGFFAPHALDKPTIWYGQRGGAEWSGASYDPVTGWLYVTANQIPFMLTLTRASAADQALLVDASSEGAKIFRANCSACHGETLQGGGLAPSLVGLGKRADAKQVAQIIQNGRGAMPPIAVAGTEREKLIDFLLRRGHPATAAASTTNSAQAGVAIGLIGKFEDADGYPATRPPWGTLNAINLNSGRIAWSVPLGEYPELTAKGIRPTGSENFGGAMATAGGLVFAAGTKDRMIRAFDKSNGRELWRYRLPFAAFAPPATYSVGGRQFIVIAATGGGKLGGERGDAYVAFALPR